MQKLRIMIAALLCFGVLGILFFPVFTRVNDGRPGPMHHLHQLYVCLMIYEQDEGAFPPMHNPSEVKNAFCPIEIKDETVLLNPANGKPLLPNPWLSGKKTKDLQEKANGIVAFYVEDSRSSNVIDAVFLNGSAKRLERKDWELAKEASHIP